MGTAVLVVWGVGLIGALVATLVILKEVALVLGALAGILRLAEITREAARGMAANVRASSGLAPLGDSAEGLREAAARLAAATAPVERKLGGLR